MVPSSAALGAAAAAVDACARRARRLLFPPPSRRPVLALPVPSTQWSTRTPLHRQSCELTGPKCANLSKSSTAVAISEHRNLAMSLCLDETRTDTWRARRRAARPAVTARERLRCVGRAAMAASQAGRQPEGQVPRDRLQRRLHAGTRSRVVAALRHWGNGPWKRRRPGSCSVRRCSGRPCCGSKREAMSTQLDIRTTASKTARGGNCAAR